MLRPATLILATALLAACQSTPGERKPEGFAAYEGDPRLGEVVNNACFTSSIDGFSMNEKKSVVLRDGKKEYMVEVFGSCPNLDDAMSIGIDSATSCLSKGDALIVSTSMMGNDVGLGPQRCQIKEIRKWDKNATKAEEPADAPADAPAE